MASKKHVLHLIQSLANGGCENMLLRTIPLLDDFDHTVITLKDSGELAPEFHAAHIKTETIGYHGLLDLPGLLRLRSIIRKKQPDIVITYLFHADMIGRTMLRTIAKTPVIPFLRTTYNHPRYHIARILERMTRPLVRTYLANSDAVKSYYVDRLGVNPGRITVIPNSIDLERFRANGRDSNLAKLLDIHQDDFIIITVANLYANKGLHYLIEAFENISGKHTGTKLLVVGDGPERETLEHQAAQCSHRKNISFLGRRSDVPALLGLADLFVLPTLFEGQSNSILEAMAARIPVITSDIPENRSIITHGKSGLLTPLRDAGSLAEAIELLRTNHDLTVTLSNNAWDVIRSRHDPAVIKKLWTNFLHSL